jgi:hypothetical protein
MSDLFGYSAPRKPFKDIRKRRDSVAEQKATYALELGVLLRKPPDRVINGGVEVTRRWRKEAESAKAVVANKRSSVHDLTRAIATMRSFEKPDG